MFIGARAKTARRDIELRGLPRPRRDHEDAYRKLALLVLRDVEESMKGDDHFRTAGAQLQTLYSAFASKGLVNPHEHQLRAILRAGPIEPISGPRLEW